MGIEQLGAVLHQLKGMRKFNRVENTSYMARRRNGQELTLVPGGDFGVFRSLLRDALPDE